MTAQRKALALTTANWLQMRSTGHEFKERKTCSFQLALHYAQPKPRGTCENIFITKVPQLKKSYSLNSGAVDLVL